MTDKAFRVRRYIFAVFAVLIAAILRAAIGHFGVRIPFVTFYPAVMIAAIYGGMRVGLLATGLSALMVATFWLEPAGPWVSDPADLIILTIFITTCIMLSYTSELMYRALTRAKEAEAQVKLAAERERAAIVIQENEERLRLAIESGNLGTWDFNPQTGEINWSDRCKEMFGLPPVANIDYQIFMDHVHPEDRQQVQDAEKAAMDHFGNGRLNIEFRSKWPDGTERWLASTAKVFFSDANGRPKAVRMIGTLADITGRREIEDALRESEQRFRVMANTIPQLAWIAKADGHIYWYNQRWYEYTGTTPEQMEGWGWTSVHDPHALPGVLERWKESIVTGKPFDMTFPLRGADGKFRQFLTRVQPVKNADGEVIQWCGTNTDVTERMRLEQELHENQSRLDLALRSAQMGVWHFDIVENRRVFDDQVCHLLGIDSEKFTGTAEEFFNVIHRDDHQKIRDALARAIHHHAQYETEYRAIWPDESIHYINARGSVVFDDKGHPVRLNGIIWDISDRKQMEEDLRKSRDELELHVRERTAELQEANKILRGQAALLEMAHDAILVRDKEGKITFWNSGATRTYGFSKDESIGRVTHELLRTRFPEPLTQIEEQIAKYGAWEGELSHTTSRGDEIIVESRWALQSDIDGKPIGILEINRDVTERKRAEEALRSNMERLEIINSELQEFAFVASHDLQEPLRKIQTFCDLTKQRCATSLDLAGQDYIERIINSAARMRQLLDDLLQYSRIAASPQPFRRVDLGKVLREAVEVFEQKIKETGAVFEIKDMPKIEMDESQMVRLFQNLIGNALKFRGEARPHILVSAACSGNNLCDIIVKDNGIGFDQIYAERIFKPFQRLHGRNQYEGTGIGLAICRKIAERHGGTIRAESEPGKGSTFILSLPEKQMEKEVKAARG